MLFVVFFFVNIFLKPPKLKVIKYLSACVILTNYQVDNVSSIGLITARQVHDNSGKTQPAFFQCATII